MIKRTLQILLAGSLLAVAQARAQTYPSPNLGSVTLHNSGSSGPGDAFTVLGRAESVRAQDSINAMDQTGINRDTQVYSGSVSIGAGGTTLTCAGCAFSAADVGKYALVTTAGVVPTTGGIYATPVSAPGSYATQPSAVIGPTQGSGVTYSGLTLNSATVAAGGTGYAASSTITLTISGGTCTTQPQVSVATNSSGVVTTINSVTTAGVCTQPPPATGAATTGGTGSGATVNAIYQIPYAVVTPLMSVQSATVAAGGSGFPASSTFNVTLSASGNNTAAVLSVTTNSSGVITTVNSVTTPGQYWNIDSAGDTVAVPQNTTGGFNSSFNVVWGVSSIDIASGGWGLSLTAGAYSAYMVGGSPVTPATLGTVTVQGAYSDLATTIASVTNGTHAVLAAAAGSGTQGGTQTVVWGHDDAPALNAGMVAACAANKDFFLPGSGYGIVSGPIILPDSCYSTIRGAGKYVTVINALGPIGLPAALTSNPSWSQYASMIFKANSNGKMAVRDIGLDGRGIATTNMFLHGAHGVTITNVELQNAAAGGTNFVVGDPTTYNYASSVIVESLEIYNGLQNGTYTSAQLPYVNMGIYSPDNMFGDAIVPVGAQMANILNGGENVWEAPHPFGYPTNFRAQYDMWLTGPARVNMPYLDTSAVAGMRLDANASTARIIAPHCIWGGSVPTTGACILISSGVPNILIDHPAVTFASFNLNVPAAQLVVQQGTPSQTAIVTTGLNVLGTPYTSGAMAPGGSWTLQTPDNLNTGGNARGNGSVDNCVGRAAPTAVASGAYSACEYGYGNTASGYASAAGGYGNTADGAYTRAFGAFAITDSNQFEDCYGGGRFNAVAGSMMSCKIILATQINSTASAQLLEGGALGVTHNFSNVIHVLLNSAAYFSGTQVCHDETTNAMASWTIAFSYLQGSTPTAGTILGSPTWTAAAGNPGTLPTPAAPGVDATFGGPLLNVAGPNIDEWGCLAEMRAVFTK